jgi:hypothetical protein
MDWVEKIFMGRALAILIILFVGSWIEKTAVEGREDADGFHRGNKNEK